MSDYIWLFVFPVLNRQFNIIEDETIFLWHKSKSTNQDQLIFGIRNITSPIATLIMLCGMQHTDVTLVIGQSFIHAFIH